MYESLIKDVFLFGLHILISFFNPLPGLFCKQLFIFGNWYNFNTFSSCKIVNQILKSIIIVLHFYSNIIIIVLKHIIDLYILKKSAAIVLVLPSRHHNNNCFARLSPWWLIDYPLFLFIIKNDLFSRGAVMLLCTNVTNHWNLQDK